ncbi:unnamed protein product [Cylicocyclus nassatus]|uniref:Uncharacterized protein n=1 Tax=Cylicocyclus nassatus TaxID=53992 RepID=A0AA36GVT2_CYLNA|nr:unnamed protein product [Cylicocyclus nassatus]
MGPPTTRARTPYNPRARSQTSSEASGNFANAITASLSDVGDDTFVLGRDAKTLRDATAQAITEAWKNSSGDVRFEAAKEATWPTSALRRTSARGTKVGNCTLNALVLLVHPSVAHLLAS